MKPETSNGSQERIRKATELLQKFWWFAFFLVIAPFIVAFIVFASINFFGVGLYIVLSLSVGSFMFAFLFFYKAFDKYRKNPFFLNKKNNLSARIHVLFLISILSFVTTPIFSFFRRSTHLFFFHWLVMQFYIISFIIIIIINQ